MRRVFLTGLAVLGCMFGCATAPDPVPANLTGDWVWWQTMSSTVGGGRLRLELSLSADNRFILVLSSDYHPAGGEARSRRTVYRGRFLLSGNTVTLEGVTADPAESASLPSPWTIVRAADGLLLLRAALPGTSVAVKREFRRP